MGGLFYSTGKQYTLLNLERDVFSPPFLLAIRSFIASCFTPDRLVMI